MHKYPNDTLISRTENDPAVGSVVSDMDTLAPGDMDTPCAWLSQAGKRATAVRSSATAANQQQEYAQLGRGLT